MKIRRIRTIMGSMQRSVLGQKSCTGRNYLIQNYPMKQTACRGTSWTMDQSRCGNKLKRLFCCLTAKRAEVFVLNHRTTLPGLESPQRSKLKTPHFTVPSYCPRTPTMNSQQFSSSDGFININCDPLVPVGSQAFLFLPSSPVTTDMKP